MESENAPSAAAAEDAEDLRMLRTAPKLLELSQNAEEEIGSVIIFPAINRYWDTSKLPLVRALTFRNVHIANN